MKALHHIFWLGTKELRTVLMDPVMAGLILFVFTFMVYMDATSLPENVNNASIAIADEDNSQLSRQIANAFYPPYFQTPIPIDADEIGPGLDQARFLFALVIPPDFEAQLRKGSQPEIQLHIDATAVMQAGLGDGYIQAIIQTEVSRYLAGRDPSAGAPVDLVLRRAYNPNGSQVWFNALNGILNYLTMVAIMLTGAALIREREHGTIEHLLVMPLTAFQIALAKIWANGLIIISVFALSMLVVFEGLLQVPMVGTHALLFAGTAVYLFAAAAIGIFLGTIARTMAQFALLIMMTIMPMMMLSGGMTPIESQPDIVQPFTWLLPSRHYMAFAEAVVFRGADLSIVWPELLTMACLGAVFLSGSLLAFRRALGTSV